MTPPKSPTPWQAATLPEVLPLYIRRSIGPGEGGCWLWMITRSDDGYGLVSFRNKTHQAHRLIYRLVVEDPGDHPLDHLCHTRDVTCRGGHQCPHRRCVNPTHLEPVTPVENQLRSTITPAGQERCLKCGGEFTWTGRQRRCLPCKSAYARRRWAAMAS